MRESSLTSKQWLLYDFLKQNYADGVYISKKKISEALGYSWNDKSDRNGREIESDVSAINDCEIINKVIISSQDGYKIASKEEAEKWLDDDLNNVLKKLRRHNKKRVKISKDNQMRLVLFRKEKDCIESFM